MSAIDLPHSARRRRILLRRSLESLKAAFASNKTALAGAVMLVLIVLAAIGAPLLAGIDPIDQDVMHRLKAPSTAHLLGTDQFGRDVFSRLLYGARVTLAIALCANLGAMVIGTLVGLCAGYFGGRLDIVLMQTMDALLRCLRSFSVSCWWR